MPNTAEYGKLEFESGQTLTAFALLSDSGDHKKLNSAANLWSDKSGYSPVVRPNGLITGGVVTPAAVGGNDDVDVAALTCYLAGVLTSVGADTDVQITRGADTDTHMICSIIVTAAGAIDVEVGTDSTAFSETRGAAGGPPLNPVGAIEVAQVRTTSVTGAPITADEIFQVVGTHKEMYNFPLWNVRYGEVSNGALAYAGVDFLSALPLIHDGPIAKRVYAQYYTPSFTEVNNASDVKLPEKTHSVSSTQVYNNVINSSSSSLGQGSFNCQLEDGLTDPVVQQKDAKLFFRFYPDRYKSPYSLCQGKLGVSRSFPAGGNITAACTISAATESLDVIA